MSDESGKRTGQWIDDAEDALGRTREALQTAWTETREARMATLETAREAVSRLGRAIEEGIDVARESWESTETEEPTGPDSTEPAGHEEE